MTRRVCVALGGLLAAAALSTSPASAQEGANCPEGNHELTIISWGGAYEASQENAYYKPYMAECPNVTIVQESASNEAVAKMRAQAEAGNVTWDVVDVVAADAIRACDEGLAMEIPYDEWLRPASVKGGASSQDLAAMIADIDVTKDPVSTLLDKIQKLKDAAAGGGAGIEDGAPATEDFGDLIVSDCFVPEIVYSTTFGYRTDVEAWGGKTPDDICDVFDLETFPGKRSLEKRPINNVEWALICDGVPPDEVYDVLETPEGMDRALAKLDTIKDEVIWWSAGAETPQRLADGEVVMGSTYNGRLFSVIEEQHQPVAMLWDWQVFDLDGWVVPAGVSDDELPAIKSFLEFATDTQRLADQAKYISYGPARKSSAPLVGKHAELGIDMAPHMPTDPKNSQHTLVYNYFFWADYRDDLDAKFQAWLAQ